MSVSTTYSLGGLPNSTNLQDYTEDLFDFQRTIDYILSHFEETLSLRWTEQAILEEAIARSLVDQWGDDTQEVFENHDSEYLMSGALPASTAKLECNSSSFGRINTGTSASSTLNDFTILRLSDSSLRFRIEIMATTALGSLVITPQHFRTALDQLVSLSADDTTLADEYCREPKRFLEQLRLWDDVHSTTPGSTTESDGASASKDGDDWISEGGWTEFPSSDPGRRLFWRYDEDEDRFITMADV